MNTNNLSITDINFEELDEATDTGSGENQLEHLQSMIEGMIASPVFQRLKIENNDVILKFILLLETIEGEN